MAPSLPGGPTRRITHELLDYRLVDLTGDGEQRSEARERRICRPSTPC